MTLTLEQRADITKSLPTDFSTDEISKWSLMYKEEYFQEMMIQTVIQLLTKKKEGYKNILKFIFKNHLDINIEFYPFKSTEKERFLFYFSNSGDVKSIKTLIKLGADISFRTDKGLDFIQYYLQNSLEYFENEVDLGEESVEKCARQWFHYYLKPFFDFILEKGYDLDPTTDARWSPFKEPLTAYLAVLTKSINHLSKLNPIP